MFTIWITYFAETYQTKIRIALPPRIVCLNKFQLSLNKSPAPYV